MTTTGRLTESEVLAPELHAGPVGTILDVAEERIGAARVTRWQGERMDYSTAIEGLQAAKERAAIARAVRGEI